MTTAPATTRPTAKPSKLVRLEQERANILDAIALDQSRTQVAQLGLIFDAGIKALGLATESDET